jgi:GPI mannosyltransferase 3
MSKQNADSDSSHSMNESKQNAQNASMVSWLPSLSMKEGGWWNGTLFALLCLYRIINTVFIQSAFDPDEYWQTLEPAYCTIFYNTQLSSNDSFRNMQCPGWTWEWRRRWSPSFEIEESHFFVNAVEEFVQSSLHGPVRSFVSVVPSMILYWLLRYVRCDTPWLVARGPMLLTAITVAAPCDYAIYTAARYMYQSSHDESSSTKSSRKSVSNNLPWWCLWASLSSWFHAYTLVRTYANCQEALCLMISIALVSPELLSDRISVADRFTLRSNVAFCIGGISVAIRFTSVAAYIPMGILLAWKVCNPTWSSRIRFVCSCCAGWGLMGVCTSMLVDRWFFGFWTLPLLGNFHFNVLLNQARLYGTHPGHFYFTTGIPVVSGLLLPFVLIEFAKLLSRRRNVSSFSTGARNLWIIVMSYLLIMSGNAHKEFRFILPVLSLLCLLVGPSLQSFFFPLTHNGKNRTVRWSLMALFCFIHAIAILYLGCYHQSGPIAIQRSLRSIAARRYLYAKSNTANQASRSLSVYYWTGQCHSTPLLSHLHVSPLTFDTWSLDCSPKCRADPSVLCEVDHFQRDPAYFAEASTSSLSLDQNDVHSFAPEHSNSQDCSLDNVCTSASQSTHNVNSLSAPSRQRAPPDFVITMSTYVAPLQPYLQALGNWSELARHPHHITGARVGPYMLGSDGLDCATFHCIRVFPWLVISVEDMILYGQNDEEAKQ